MGFAEELPAIREDCLLLISSIITYESINEQYELTDDYNSALYSNFMNSHYKTICSTTLNIAVKLRNHFDIHSNNIVLKTLLDDLFKYDRHGICGEVIQPHKENLSLKEVCNKIIHGTSIRTISNKEKDKSRRYKPFISSGNIFISDLIEVHGSHKGTDWVCRVNLKVFCQQAYDVYNKVELTLRQSTWDKYGPIDENDKSPFEEDQDDISF